MLFWSLLSILAFGSVQLAACKVDPVTVVIPSSAHALLAGPPSSRQVALGTDQGPEGWKCTLLETPGTWACTDPDSLSPSTCHLSAGSDSVWVCAPVEKDECELSPDGWDLGLHVMSIFVVFLTSLIGCSIPILASPFLQRKWPRRILFVLKHCGTGVFLSTAFVHLLFESFSDFSNPCLPELAYEATAPAIAMASLLVIFFLDFQFARAIKLRRQKRLKGGGGRQGERRVGGCQQDVAACSSGLPVVARSSDPSPKTSFDETSLEAASEEDPPLDQAKIDVYLLEGGVAFHSVMIGVGLSTMGGSAWLSYFIAIVFHQALEGVGLGSRIATLNWETRPFWRKMGLAMVFALVTPLGMAIGAGIHASYNPNSTSAILAVAILNSISAGILLWAGIVELLVHDFLQCELSTAPWPKVCVALASLLSGAAAMSALANWA